jgi:hypothetical protein
MRTLTIERRPGQVGDPVEVNILSDNHLLGVMKAEDKSTTFEISKGEHAIQVEIPGEDGQNYRTNIFFATGSKNVKVFFEGSALALKLLLR